MTPTLRSRTGWRRCYLGSVPEDDNAARCEAQEVVDTVLALNTQALLTQALRQNALMASLDDDEAQQEQMQ